MELLLQDRNRVGVPDAVLLDDHTNKIVFRENLRKRFQQNIIYTYIGPVLVSVNPYKELNIYGKKQIETSKGKHFFEAEPHIFVIADVAYNSLIEEGHDQCILISGESGAGKTEASKKVLQYISEITDVKGNVENVKDKLLFSNPLLEAFGNAKTQRNNNSSRFGKYMDIAFDSKGHPKTGHILSYLLEKSRVISQLEGERNFHIFYQLLAGASDSELNELDLSRNLNTFRYLSDGDTHESKMQDAADFFQVKKALDILEFSSTSQKEIFSILSAILHLGNADFDDFGGVCNVKSPQDIKLISKLLDCGSDELIKALTHRTIETKGDVVVTPLDLEKSQYARDALAKALYDRLFTWLVTSINLSLQSLAEGNGKKIGILDIYGFEIFQKNSFEQLCINFCNEKLQQLFIDLTLKSEQLEYENEGIKWERIDYFDNKIICDLIEEKHKGIIAFMDEECLRPGEPNDMSLLEKLDTQLGDHIHYLPHKKANIQTQKTMGRDAFRVIHYAGEVTYQVNGFIDKNKDLLFRDLRESMSYSKNNILQQIFPKSEQTNIKMPDTAITKFKNSLNSLIKELKTKEPSYIRCIKPNDKQHPGVFDEALVDHQIKYLGLMENLRVRRAGFAYRRTYDKFLHRYKCLNEKTWPNWHGAPKDGVTQIVKGLGFKEEDFKLGLTKIFIKDPQSLFKVEDSFQEKKNFIAAIIQSKWKGRMQRKKYLEMKAAVIMVQKYARRFLAIREAKRKRAAIATIRKFINGFITRNGPPNADNKAFIQVAIRQWLIRLSKNLPKTVMDKSWPPCPFACNEASKILHELHIPHLARKYMLGLTPKKRHQFELKVIAERLFKEKKKSYQTSIPQIFHTDRVADHHFTLKQSYLSSLHDEKEIYCSDVYKYDRHGYKPRARIVIITNKNLHLVDVKSSIKVKHVLSLQNLNFVVTPESDNLLVVRIPENLVKKEKGDLILEIPQLIEAVTQIINITKKENTLQVIDKNSIEHTMKGKSGTIDVTTGNPQRIYKSKSGHLLIVAPP